MTEFRHPELKPTYDIVVKKIFSNKTILTGFINNILGLNVSEVSLGKNERQHLMPSHTKGEHFHTAVDVKATTEDGLNFIIEIQVAYSAQFINRVLTYTAEHVVEDMQEVKEDKVKTHILHRKLKPYYVIAIVVDEKFNDDIPLPFSRYELVNVVNGEALKVALEGEKEKVSPFIFAILNLGSYNEQCRIEKSHLDWFRFFSNRYHGAFTIPAVQMADDLLDMNSWSKEELEELDIAKRNEAVHYDELDSRLKVGKVDMVIELFNDGDISEKTAIKHLIKLGLSEQEAEARLK